MTRKDDLCPNCQWATVEDMICSYCNGTGSDETGDECEACKGNGHVVECPNCGWQLGEPIEAEL